MKIALAQFNPTVGDIAGNVRAMAAMIDRARDAGAELVAFPELSILGYPPKDLLLKPGVIADNVAALHELAGRCTDIAALVGYAEGNRDPVGRGLHNCVALLAGGKVISNHVKRLLPTYDVFDETRYFEPGEAVTVAELQLAAPGTGRLAKLGLTVCEDLWNEADFGGRRLYDSDPAEELVAAGAEVVINISASPFVLGKAAFRRELLVNQARSNGVPVLYVNQVGGNDDLIFDGASFALDAEGNLIAQAKAFAEDLLLVDLDKQSRVESVPEGIESVHPALVLGLRDYVRKCGFSDVLLGLSGGIDSAVTATLAVDALGAEHVHGVAMPSRYSSAGSLADAEALAANLGISFRTIEIQPMHAAFEQVLTPIFAESEQPPGTAEENVQARIRGNVLMGISNKFGYLVLSTGNKSELAVGYCTLYGDMSGGLAVISDVPKTMVYRLARWLNRDGERIPESTITKPPSAELKPDQTDQDALPPYDVLDDILERYVEREQSAAGIIAAGHDASVVARVVRMVDVNEYKRKQAAPGLKVTGRAFGTGRRMPIAQRYRPLGDGWKLGVK